jgi:SPP1 gp7 family putative phage head morphogenesis protein
MAKPKNTKAFLVDASVRHQIYVNRFSASQVKEMLPYLTRIRRNTAAELEAGAINNMSKKRLTRLYNEITGINAAALATMGKKLKTNMKEFAAYEKNFSARMLTKGVKVDWDIPTDKQVTSAIFSEPVLTLREKGLSVDDILDEFSDKKSKQLVQVIQEGVITGKSNANILQDMSYAVDTQMANGLNALVRTVTMHVSNVARQEIYRENADVIIGVEWVATLDSDTCIICGSMDREFFPSGSPIPDRPHFNCRCTTIPIVDPKYSIIGSVEGLERPARGSDGPEQGISHNTTYSEWLKDQPAWFQDEALGKGKGQIFRDGGLKITRFVDDDRQPLTLDDLKNSDGRAIKSAITKSGIMDDEE